MCAEFRKAARNAALVGIVESQLVSDIVFPDTNWTPEATGKNIAIVGGELFNKGAQAMTFTVVDQMAKRYPDKDVYLLSGRDYNRDDEEKDQYAFDILPWGPEVQLSLLSSNSQLANTKRYSQQAKESVQQVFESCSMLIDINGYALSSQMGLKRSFRYLGNIVAAKKYGIPMYILPQSIGPFDYSTGGKLVLNPLLRTYLSYPEIICPREHAGVKSLKPYTRHNVQREFDIVLQTEAYDLDTVYSSEPDLELKELESEAVGIIPNSKVFERTNSDDLYSLYEEAIEKLLEADKSVYVLRHSVEDLDHCRNIKDRFTETDDVHLFENDFDAPELEHIIDQFDFLIGSRYHSIVHAYKHNVPVIAIGWAVKYAELLTAFEQSEYCYEGRDQIDHREFIASVKEMNQECQHQSESIRERSSEIRQNNLFDRLFSN